MALQFLAAQFEFQLAVAIAGLGIFVWHPHATVPDDNGAGAIVAGRNYAFEIGVVERMIFDMHGHALDGWVEARSLGHGPAFERAIEFQAEVVMQAARGVLLDDERMRRWGG